MKREGKKSNVFITCIIAVAVIAICIFFRFKVKDIKIQNYKDNKVIEEYNKQIEKEHERKENLEILAKYVKTKQFVESWARNKLGLVYPNEIIYRKEE